MTMNVLNKIKYYYRYNGLKNTVIKIYTTFLRLNKFKAQQLYNFNTIETFNNNNIILKNKNIFVFATVPFFDIGGGQRSAQISKMFNNLGYNIFYIYAFPSSEKKNFEIDIPISFHKYIKNTNFMELQKYVKSDDLFVFEAPIKDFLEYLALAKLNKCKIIYENIDNWETSLGNDIFDENTLKLMINEATLLTSTSKMLVNQTNKYLQKYQIKNKKHYYLPNAVDEQLFDPTKNYKKPKDLITGRVTLLYYGSLWGEWFDWETIKYIALKDKTISINLIGEYTNIQKIVDSMPTNIHFLGLKKQSDLPSYLKYSDYAILPFKPGNISNYVSPLKIFEYISMQKIVLANNLPDIKNYPNTYIMESKEKWYDFLKKDIELMPTENFIKENSWLNRCNILLDTIYNNKISKEYFSNISIIILNYNNKKVIFKCIDSLLMFNKRYNYQIIVVDNQSTDGSYEEIKKRYTQKIKLLRNNKNGCSSGRNLGAKYATGKYLLFLDSDQWVISEKWLDNYINIFANNDLIGAISWGAGWIDKKKENLTVDGFKNRFMEPHILARSDIGYLATSGLMMSKELFEIIGGFDINYDPTCFEDTDLSFAIRNAKKQIYYSKYLGVRHLPHQTTKSGSLEHKSLFEKKQEYFYKKWSLKNKQLIESSKK